MKKVKLNTGKLKLLKEKIGNLTNQQMGNAAGGFYQPTLAGWTCEDDTTPYPTLVTGLDTSCTCCTATSSCPPGTGPANSIMRCM